MKPKFLSPLFAILAIVLSNVMCAAIAYNYCSLQYCQVCSAPASTAILLAIPYGIAIALCALLSWFFRRKAV